MPLAVYSLCLVNIWFWYLKSRTKKLHYNNYGANEHFYKFIFCFEIVSVRSYGKVTIKKACERALNISHFNRACIQCQCIPISGCDPDFIITHSQ